MSVNTSKWYDIVEITDTGTEIVLRTFMTLDKAQSYLNGCKKVSVNRLFLLKEKVSNAPNQISDTWYT